MSNIQKLAGAFGIKFWTAWGLCVVLGFSGVLQGEEVLQAGLKHLRFGETQEWSDFPEEAEGNQLELVFRGEENSSTWFLQLRQQDVRQAWDVQLNGQVLGRLTKDERDLIGVYEIPVGKVLVGENRLQITPSGNGVDDIRVGEIRLYKQPLREWLRQASVEIVVRDGDSGKPLPCKLSIVRPDKALVPVGANSNDRLAVRTGTIYTADGTASFGIAPGDYVIYAGRGFEYGVDQIQLHVEAGEKVRRELSIRREVPTEGLVGCDTHIHTLTHSGHGDANVTERGITIAGEGLDVAVAADHNVYADYMSEARRLGLDRYFTGVVGCEVTTRLCHVNVFPVDSGAKPIDPEVKSWEELYDRIFATPGVQVAVLNHPRDVHSGFRPFGPEDFLSATGENLRGWKLRANALEMINSAALQSDPMLVVHDWFGLLNQGLKITPVGASDSHEVDYKTVGQARTYLPADDREPGKISLEQVSAGFREGRTIASFGLLPRLFVNGEQTCGDMVRPEQELEVKLQVFGPSWTQVEEVMLFGNGELLQNEKISVDSPGNKEGGLKYEVAWKLDRPSQDLFLSAVVLGPGPQEPFWEVRRPYQPSGPEWEPKVMGITGAIWVDGDGDGQWSSARDYARKLLTEHAGDMRAVVDSLRKYDSPTACQALGLLAAEGKSPLDGEVSEAFRAEHVREAFVKFVQAWKESQAGRGTR